jgi:hypothetical protein
VTSEHGEPKAPGDKALGVTAALVFLQGLGLAGIAVFYLVEILLGRAGDTALAVLALALQMVAAAALVLVARGLRNGRRWSRSPALLTQLFVIPISVGLLQGGRWYVGVPLLVWGIVVIVLLFSPAVATALEE